VAVLSRVVSVLAVSSGSGINCIESLRSYLSLRKGAEIVQFFPFNDIEVKRYIHLNELNIPPSVLKPITGNNLYLLSFSPWQG